MRILAPFVMACVVFVCTQSFAETGYLTKNDIAYCEESYGHYKLLGDYKFLEREKRTMESRVCVHLYADSIWTYSGSDRTERLLERGNYYVNYEIAQSKQNAEKGITPQAKPPTQQQSDGIKILELQKRVADLEKKLAQKDAIISEQVKVIMSLASKIKSMMFEVQVPFFDIRLF